VRTAGVGEENGDNKGTGPGFWFLVTGHWFLVTGGLVALTT
jgi:hypothetical protein